MTKRPRELLRRVETGTIQISPLPYRELDIEVLRELCSSESKIDALAQEMPYGIVLYRGEDSKGCVFCDGRGWWENVIGLVMCYRWIHTDDCAYLRAVELVDMRAKSQVDRVYLTPAEDRA